jgi:hypothetical protein
MKIITPIDIDETNMGSSISEPDLTRNEALWIPSSRDLDPLHPFTRYTRDALNYYALSTTTGFVIKFDLNWVYISEWDSGIGTITDITTDGTDLYLMKRIDLSAYARKFSTAGVYSGQEITVGIQFAPRAICWDGIYLYCVSGFTNQVIVSKYIFSTNTNVLNATINYDTNLNKSSYSMFQVSGDFVFVDIFFIINL